MATIKTLKRNAINGTGDQFWWTVEEIEQASARVRVTEDASGRLSAWVDGHFFCRVVNDYSEVETVSRRVIGICVDVGHAHFRGWVVEHLLAGVWDRHLYPEREALDERSEDERLEDEFDPSEDELLLMKAERLGAGE